MIEVEVAAVTLSSQLDALMNSSAYGSLVGQ
jgi:hypothetical protein